MINRIDKFFEFEPFESKMKRSAGVIVIYNSKVLLCHPTGSKWFGSYSFPKGGIDEGESEIDAAVRELREETSIVINKNKLDKNPIIVDYVNKKGTKYKKLYLYKLYINDLSEIGLESEIIPKENLQLEEIDWGGFLDKMQASVRIFHRVSHILETI